MPLKDMYLTDIREKRFCPHLQAALKKFQIQLMYTNLNFILSGYYTKHVK